MLLRFNTLLWIHPGDASVSDRSRLSRSFEQGAGRPDSQHEPKPRAVYGYLGGADRWGEQESEATGEGARSLWCGSHGLGWMA